MTFEEMIAQVQELSVSERKELIKVIVDSLATEATPPVRKKRIFNLHAGMVWMSDDFDDELPDSFWLGDEE